MNPHSRVDALREQIGGPRDGALLRYSLGLALMLDGNARESIWQIRAALGFDPDYSAAWKLLGKACLEAGDAQGAGDAWRRGIAVADQRGDVQAAREMRVFLQRLDKQMPG
jgi:predicted Zn-dependent protease